MKKTADNLDKRIDALCNAAASGMPNRKAQQRRVQPVVTALLRHSGLGGRIVSDRQGKRISGLLVRILVASWGPFLRAECQTLYHLLASVDFNAGEVMERLQLRQAQMAADAGPARRARALEPSPTKGEVPELW